MKKLHVDLMHFKALNDWVRDCEDSEIFLDNLIGQRYVAAGSQGKNIIITGTPGNALGCYLDGSSILVNGNAQDATGDTMNSGSIIIDGNCGDTTGYGMRGGMILVRGDAGYRAGIHMKQYKDHIPVLVIGGKAGSFLGEYQAGGVIIVLGKGCDGKQPTGFFCGTGMHGGRMFLRCDEAPDIPIQVKADVATDEDKASIRKFVEEYCDNFGGSADDILKEKFYVLTPNTHSPYERMYTFN
ncbi:MAG: glutamate synthase [Eubacteriales bacterium]|nr:glutamate synthase [Eubacteriales bacterium]